jgi:hypothetical protein
VTKSRCSPISSLIAPAIQVLDDQHPQNALDRCGRTPIHRRPRDASEPVGLHGLEHGVGVAYASPFGQHGVQRQAQRRPQGKAVHGLIAIAQPTVFSLIQQVSVHDHMREDKGFAPQSRLDVAIKHDVPFQQIIDLTSAKQVDLIVMGTHGRTDLQHFLLGNVAERVVRLAPCPVLVMRSPTPTLPS